MFARAVLVEYKEGTVLEATFRDGTVKRFDIASLYDEFPAFKALEDRSLFTSGKLMGGYGIVWNDTIDIAIEAIYDGGETVRVEKPLPGIVAGDAVVAARSKRDWTQKKLSEVCKIDQSDISKIERGLANPSVETLTRIAEALGCDLVVSFVPKDPKDPDFYPPDDED